MSISWLRFRSYRIIDKGDGVKEIEYRDGNSFDFASLSSANIETALMEVGITIPGYMRCEPPISGKLSLAEPSLVALACEEIIELLVGSSTPANKSELKERIVDKVSEDISSFVNKLERIKKWSEDGYYLVTEID